eukprot:6206016-Pleurochrysis_carterae.AAC.3
MKPRCICIYPPQVQNLLTLYGFTHLLPLQLSTSISANDEIPLQPSSSNHATCQPPCHHILRNHFHINKYEDPSTTAHCAGLLQPRGGASANSVEAWPLHASHARGVVSRPHATACASERRSIGSRNVNLRSVSNALTHLRASEARSFGAPTRIRLPKGERVPRLSASAVPATKSV